MICTAKAREWDEEAKNITEHQNENGTTGNQLPVNPYYTPEEEAKHRENVRKRFSGSVLQNVAIHRLGAALVGIIALIISAFSSLSAEEYVEAKYQQDFFIVKSYEWGDQYCVEMSPESDPSILVRVLVTGDTPWNKTFTDNYYAAVASKYMKSRVKELVVSRYAEKVFCTGTVWPPSNGSVGDPRDIAERAFIENTYTTEQVMQGSRVAPEAFKNVGIQIILFGTEDKQEQMIQEAFEMFRQYAEEYPLGVRGISLLVADINIYKNDEKVRQQCENHESLYHNDLVGNKNGKFAWFYEHQNGVDPHIGLWDYDFFRNFTREKYPHLWEN